MICNFVDNFGRVEARDLLFLKGIVRFNLFEKLLSKRLETKTITYFDFKNI